MIQAFADLEASGDFIARDAPSVAQVFVSEYSRVLGLSEANTG